MQRDLRPSRRSRHLPRSGALSRLRRILPCLACAALVPVAAGCEIIANIEDPILDTSGTTSTSTSSSSSTSTSTSTSSTSSVPDCSEAGIVIEPPFADAYLCVPVGPAAPPDQGNVYTGGLAFDPADEDTLYFVAFTNDASEHLRSLKLLRDADGHVSGVAERNDHFADLPGAAGIAFHPDGTLLIAMGDPPLLVQRATIGGADGPTVDLSALGLAGRAETLGFIPAGVPGAGRLAISSGAGDGQSGHLYTGLLTGASAGAHGLDALSGSEDLLHGAGGIAYVAPGSPAIEAPSMLFANIWSSTIDLHAVGPDGVPSAESVVLASFEQDGSGYGPWGMTVDRKSGDVLFMHYSRVYLYALRGFVPPESAP